MYIDTNKVLYWGAIENATSYMVQILGNNYSTKHNFYDLKQTALKDYIGQVNITVTANNDAGVATSAPCVYINRPVPITGIQISNLDRVNKQVTISWNPQIQYSYTIIYRLYINNTLIADNLTNTSYTFDYNNYFKDGGRYVIAVDSLVNGVGSQPVSSFTYTYKEIEVEKDAIKKAKIKINETTTTPEYPISVNAENVIVKYNDGTHENVQVVLEDKAERSLYQDDKIDLGGSSSKQHGVYSASIGTETLASGGNSIAVGDAAHAEGLNSSSFGNGTYAIAESSHTEGQGTSTTEEAKYAHAEGWATKARGVATHVEGYNNSAMTNYSHAEGTETVASGVASHAEGIHTVSDAEGSHAEGYWTAAYGLHSHAEGESILNASGTGYANILKAEGRASHAEGRATIASGDYSHAEGAFTSATASKAHAEGYNSHAEGYNSHAEGIYNTASGVASHAEGGDNTASGVASHAEGGYSTTYSLAGNIVSGASSHVGGVHSNVSSRYSFAHGCGLKTIGNIAQAAFGEYNYPYGSALFCVGNGKSDTDRKNAFLITSDGTFYLNGLSMTVEDQKFNKLQKWTSSGLTSQPNVNWVYVNPGRYHVEHRKIENWLEAYLLKAKVSIPAEVNHIHQMNLKLGWKDNYTYISAEQFIRYGNELEGYFFSSAPEGAVPAIFGSAPTAAVVQIEIVYSL